MLVTIAQYPDPTAKVGLTIYATSKIIDHFVGGLHRHIRQALLPQRFETLENAIDSAKRFVYRMDFHDERLGYRREKSNQSFGVTILSCNYCKRKGHVEKECRTKKFHAERRNNNQHLAAGGQNSHQERNDNRYYQQNRSDYPRSNNENYHQHLNEQGRTNSAHRQAQTQSRVNPIFTNKTESIPLEQLQEITSEFSLPNNETNEENSY